MGWDAARVAAAVPSGVGFLGAGLIWKGSTTTSLKNIDGEVVKSTSQSVHGLTTAASVWLSAAVGVAVSGGSRLYIVSIYGVAFVILILRLGPQMYFAKDSESFQDFDDEVDSEIDWESVTEGSSQDRSYSDDQEDNNLEYHDESTAWGIANDSPRRKSSLFRHASAPNIKMMTYEIPIVDHEKDKQTARQAARRGRGTANMLKLSFHG
eukprot:CAMPEP_0172304652 /NCGR_PEP_ID=MMETSP1058-20130122/6038_1 /TAXON_ID=83371 /ORGANISM="Detonula confervacea, Strain CCMP 353" /LENGTH=208 /DNA_ID=CAMNT_0013015979 /DNA_START=377 /DNA_END=1003 /DNA_ORIENTATION=+